MIYLYFYLIISSILVLQAVLSERNKYLYGFLNFTLFSVVALLPGLRGDVGSDTFNYTNIYQNIEDLVFFYEPVFSGITALHKKLVNDVTNYFLLYSVLQSILLYYATRKIKSRKIFIFIYLTTYYLNFHFNVIRVGLALLLFMLAIQNEKKSHSLIILGLSVMTHFSMILFLPYFMAVKKTGIKYFYVVLAIFLLTLFFMQDLLLAKLYIYMDEKNLSLTGGPSTIGIIFLLLGFLLSISPKITRKNELMLLTFFSFTVLVSGYIDIFYRVYNALFVLMFFYICKKYRLTDNIFGRKFSAKPVILYAFIVYMVFTPQVWLYVINEESLRSSENTGFNYLPYSFYFDSRFR